MTVIGWNLLDQAVSMAGRLEQLEEEIQGGPLTAVLNQLGEVLDASAADHARQATRSTDPQRRIAQAADAFQTAYFAYAAAAERGRPALRALFRPTDLRSTHDKAGGCASWVAVFQAYLGESPANIREWLDRVEKHLAEDWRVLQGRKTLRDKPLFGEFVLGEAHPYYPEWIDRVSRYLNLESRLLPADLIRERPRGRQSVLEP